MCSRVNIRSGKCPVGEIATRTNVWSGKCQVGEVSVWELSSRGCVSRGNVQPGKCPDSDFSGLKIVQIMPLSHNIFWTWAMLCLRVFNIGICRMCKPNHCFFWQFFLIWKWQILVCKLYMSNL